MKYTQIPSTAFQNIQLNAGILVDGFTPSTGTIGNLLGATSGGSSFTDTMEFKDFGDDIDNCPKNMKQLKKLQKHEAKMSGTFVTIDAATALILAAAADVDELDATHIIPRNDLEDGDFKDIWWIGDYSDVNDGSNAGFVAIHMMDVLNTGGFKIQSTDREKGKFAFEFTAHYDMENQTRVPYEIYVRQGGADPTPSVLLNKHAVSVKKDATVTLTASTIPAGATVTWSSSDSTKASVSNGVVTGEAVGNAIITASITQSGVTYSDTCTVVVTAE